ncbi:MAG: VRR-NUC domain-containing protein [Thermoleophilia bacterium]|nr:VRR-NUC domain-containing protein [Thermoleophilia bacterium]
MQFEFRQWDGPIGPWAEHFGKGRGQVHSLDGTEPLRSCNEVEVAKRLRAVRDHAFWFSGYNPSKVPEIWRPWVRSLDADVPDWLTSLDARIRDQIRSAGGGMPDVIAWNDLEPLGSALFIECKGHRERFGEAQEDWVWAARRAGVRLSQIDVSVRQF